MAKTKAQQTTSSASSAAVNVALAAAQKLGRKKSPLDGLLFIVAWLSILALVASLHTVVKYGVATSAYFLARAFTVIGCCAIGFYVVHFVYSRRRPIRRFFNELLVVVIVLWWRMVSACQRFTK